AAGLGLFGQLRVQKVDEMSYERLGLLEDAAAVMGETRSIVVPVREEAAKPETVHDQVLLSQQGREYELTVNQVYCDGRKLYYSYTLKTMGERVSLYDGEATGFERWNEAYKGERFADAFDLYLGEEENQRVADWLDSHQSGCAVRHNAFVGDGADLPDGTYMNPIDSGNEQVDANTMTAYYEVALPEGYVPGETVEFVLTVMTSDTVYAQDESGTYSTTVMDRNNLVEVKVSAPVTGSMSVLTGEGTADGYAAKAELHVSDVDLSGSVRIEALQEYHPEGYMLLADGVEYRNLDPWFAYDGQAHVLNLRFDLPETMNSLVLMPLDPAYAHEAITLK
ncbi:MAG: DUF4179 domain-containing protein, partial [Kiritimatiellae bacterium]|nr:DUF4179 domain-containing protein [Kiritimatiellia bacterium]